MSNFVGAKDLKRRVTSALVKANPDINENDLYFTQTATGHYVSYNPAYPESTPADFVVAQDLNGCITITGNFQALIPTIRHFEDLGDFELWMEEKE